MDHRHAMHNENPKHDGRLEPVEAGVVEMFSGMMRSLGLPPSIGSIYGLLYITREPLCLDDLCQRLAISKGSASQGLAVLKKLGALRAAESRGRREYYHAATDLKMLVAGFLRSEVLPSLDRGNETLDGLRDHVARNGDRDHRKFLEDRLSKLSSWQNRGRQILGLLHRFID